MDNSKPQIQKELEKLGWHFNPAAEYPSQQWSKQKFPGRRGGIIGQDSPEWVQDVATAMVSVQMKKGL